MTAGSIDNVLLITYDSLRYDTWVELQPDLTAGPNLEQAGVSFSQAFATGPGTTPSFPGLLTGTLPLSDGGLGPLTADRPRVAAELRDRGLATAGFHSNPFLSASFNYDLGFDVFEDYQHPLMGIATRIFPRGIELNNPRLERIDDAINLTGIIQILYRMLNGKARPYVRAEVVTNDAIRWLDDTPDPFFCWAHYMDVHHPCHPPQRYRTEFDVDHVDLDTVARLYSLLLSDPAALSATDIDDLVRLYHAAIVYVDHQVDRLLQALESAGRLEHTLVVVTSDHGELFGDHGAYGKPERMYSELIRVPLVVVNGDPALDTAEDDLVSLVDLPSLIHDALGFDVPTAYEGVVPGTSPREYIIAEHEVHGDPIVGARSRDWLYEIDEIRGERRLTDVHSQEQLAPTSPPSAEAERVRVKAEARFREIRGRTRTDDDVQLDGSVVARLEDLGYR